MKGIYITALVFGAFLGQAQADLYNKLHSFIATHTKEKTTQRLIALTVWSVSDKTSRDKNVQFEKVYNVYSNAKLKGGNKGIIVLNISLDKDVIMADITLKKDGVVKTIKIPLENTDIVNALKDKTPGYNVVFDENGNLVLENMDTENIFTSIQKLITR